MGANNSTRRVSFESDENDNITVVKGIRLSENVIKRMREPADPPKQQQHAPTSPPSMPPAPLPRPVPPLFDPITSLPPSPPLVPPVAPSPPPPPAPPATETVAAPPPPPPPQPPTEQPTGVPVPEPVAVPESSPVPPPTAPPAVNEEALRKKITDELYKGLEQDRAKAEQELQAWLQAEKARLSAQAKEKARSQVQDEVSRILSVERTASQESLHQSLVRERIEEERRRVLLYAKQLEAREAQLKKQDAFYREQVARLEERSAQFYKATTESYHKAAADVNAKFKRYEVYPVCADLQGQILACYKDNAGKTLNCSNIAALYLQCVNEAKLNKLRTGG